MINNFSPADTSLIRKFYEEAFEVLDREKETPEIEVTFYPYVGINHTIRLRNGKIFVRLAEISRSAPAQIPVSYTHLTLPTNREV